MALIGSVPTVTTAQTDRQTDRPILVLSADQRVQSNSEESSKHAGDVSQPSLREHSLQWLTVVGTETTKPKLKSPSLQMT